MRLELQYILRRENMRDELSFPSVDLAISSSEYVVRRRRRLQNIIERGLERPIPMPVDSGLCIRKGHRYVVRRYANEGTLTDIDEPFEE